MVALTISDPWIWFRKIDSCWIFPLSEIAIPAERLGKWSIRELLPSISSWTPIYQFKAEIWTHSPADEQPY